MCLFAKTVENFNVRKKNKINKKFLKMKNNLNLKNEIFGKENKTKL